jgi:serine phosphatase RsbU (regulator of sigma subunit)
MPRTAKQPGLTEPQAFAQRLRAALTAADVPVSPTAVQRKFNALSGDAALIRIDLTNKAVEYVGAKINLYELNASGDVEQHKADRISLGYRDSPRLKPATHQWTPAPGSRLVLVTDGVTDQMGGDKQPLLAFGYKRMLAVLQASSSGDTAHLVQQLLLAVAGWQGTQARRDDVTILALEI